MMLCCVEIEKQFPIDADCTRYGSQLSGNEAVASEGYEEGKKEEKKKNKIQHLSLMLVHTPNRKLHTLPGMSTKIMPPPLNICHRNYSPSLT
jgi:hypothetical protein